MNRGEESDLDDETENIKSNRAIDPPAPARKDKEPPAHKRKRKQAPGQAPDRTPDQAPGQISNQTTDLESGRAPDQAPNHLPDRAPQQAPDQTPDLTTKQAPDKTPERPLTRSAAEKRRRKQIIKQAIEKINAAKKWTRSNTRPPKNHHNSHSPDEKAHIKNEQQEYEAWNQSVHIEPLRWQSPQGDCDSGPIPIGDKGSSSRHRQCKEKRGDPRKKKRQREDQDKQAADGVT